ncbi:MAG: ABC transporter ATP-binding protein [Chloroflexi bacterium]|nr:ABC transporter ATP-binding protein [Chloroflexota bacterium]
MSKVLSVENVGKEYRLGLVGAGSFREDFLRWRRRGQAADNQTASVKDVSSIWALRNISFQVQQGEALGIIGRNGAGKSTLLKILSRITAPTEGIIKARGKLASLLEVGTGFHPELTGRENIFLNGMIMGMTRAEIQRKFDQIVDFSGVEQFIDTPVKRYSSGMYVRLAFAVSAHLEPEILIVDEVLAVGDAQFQKKCMGKMQDVTSGGRTVLFVSHNMGAIQSLCQRVIWVKNGQVMGDGDSRKIVAEYLDSADTTSVLYTPEPNRGYTDLILESALFRDSQGEVAKTFSSGDSIRIEVRYNALKKLPRPNFWVVVESSFGSLFGANMLFDGASPDYIEGQGVIACTFSGIQLMPQRYTVTFGIRHENGYNNYIPATELGSFSIIGGSSAMNMSGDMAHNFFETFYALLVPYAWQLPDGKLVPVNGFRDSKLSTD